MLKQLAQGALLALLLRVTPAVSPAPAKLAVRVQADAGVQLMVTIEGENYFRSSVEARDGYRTHTFYFRDVPEGAYTVTVFQADAWGHIEATQSQQILVN